MTESSGCVNVWMHCQKMLSRQRKHIAVRRGLREDSSDSDGTSRSSVHYLASQYLADSSLNSDVSQFDFATSVMPLCTLCHYLA